MDPLQGRWIESEASAAAPGGKAQNPNTGCFGESLLLAVEGQQSVGSDFDGDGDMEEIHPADGNGKAMFGAQFARATDGTAPVELRVRPVAEPDFLFEEADLIARLPGFDGPGSLQMSQGLEDLDAMPRSPDDPRQWMMVKKVIAIPWFTSLCDLQASTTKRPRKPSLLEPAQERYAVELRLGRIAQGAGFGEFPRHARAGLVGGPAIWFACGGFHRCAKVLGVQEGSSGAGLNVTVRWAFGETSRSVPHRVVCTGI